MQQLTHQDITQALSLQGDNLLIALPLPSTPLKTTQWTERFAALFDFTCYEADWGADRYQIRLRNNDVECLLCIEWLCEAMWLTPLGQSHSATFLKDWLYQKKS